MKWKKTLNCHLQIINRNDSFNNIKKRDGVNEKMKKKLILTIIFAVSLIMIQTTALSSPLNDDSEFLDQSQINHDKDYTKSINGDQQIYAQSFTPELDTLTRVELLCKREGNSDYSNQILISVKENLDAENIVTMSISLKNAKIPNGSTPEWISFDFDDVSVVIGETYYILCQQQKTKTEESFQWFATSADSSYSPGSSWSYLSSENSWSNIGGDFCFKTYGQSQQNRPPVADAGGPYHAYSDSNYKVTFSAENSFDRDGDIIYYQWDFGDNRIGHGKQITHDYETNDEEEIIVTLTIYDNSGNKDIDTTTVSFHNNYDNQPPIMQLQYPKGGELVYGTVTVEWFAVGGGYVGKNLPIYLYLRCLDGDAKWKPIAGPINNTGLYQWDTSAMSDGHYQLLIEAVGMEGIGYDTSDSFLIGSDESITVDVSIKDDTWNPLFYVKNHDSIIISASINGPGSSFFTRNDITADLSGFGMGSTVKADEYNGITATWILSNIQCNPTDGEIMVTIDIDDYASGSASIIADNTNPEISFQKPGDGLYFMNGLLFPFFDKPIVIGPIEIEVDVFDENPIEKAVFFIDDVQQIIIDDNPYEWYINQVIVGTHDLKVTVYDPAGNSASASRTITFIRLFKQ